MSTGDLRTGAAAGHRGYFHTALCYSSDEEFLDAVVPFLAGGEAAGEPTLVVVNPRVAKLVRSALPAGTAVRFASGDDVYDRPAATIRTYRRRLADYVAAGARQIRIVGEVPATAATWNAWARYESAINVAYDDWPLWSICTYDRRTTPAATLDDVELTHPRLAGPGEMHTTSGTYVGPDDFLSELPPVPLDPVQLTPPSADLADPAPAQAREAVRAAAHGQVLLEDVDDLVVAVSEAVTNAMLHGLAPTRLRVWSGPGSIVASVTDAGNGPKDPYVGLLPGAKEEPGGRGLWIVHQACAHVVMSREADGFTLRMTSGTPG